MQHLLDRRLAQFQRRRLLALTLDRLWPALAVGACLAAAGVILIRSALPELAVWVWPVAAVGVLVALAVAPLLAGRAEPRHLAAARLDRAVGAEGLVMALAERSPEARDPDWLARTRQPLEEAAAPPLRGSGAWPALVGILAILVGIGLPQREPEGLPVSPPIRPHLEKLEKRLAAMSERGLLAPDERQDLEAQLERLVAQAAQTGMSQTTWEGLDRLDQRLAEDLQEASRRLAEALVAARETSGTLTAELPPETAPEDATQDPPPPRDRDRLKRPDPDSPAAREARADATRRLLERLQREAQDPALGRLAGSLGELAQQAPGVLDRLSPEAQAALRQLLENAKAREALKKLAEAGLLDGSAEGGSGSTPLDPEQVARLLEELERALEEGRVSLGAAGADGPALELMIARLEALARAGSGGASRGPGHARLSKDATPKVEVGTRDRLPDGAVTNPDGSVKLAESVRAPELDEAALLELARGALLEHAPGHADARRAGIARRHRAAVGRYFETGGKTP
jgi:hypothetical protein